MAIATISREGLAAMAILVALLWGCLVGERLTVRRADHDATQALHDLQVLRVKGNRPAARGSHRHHAGVTV